MRVQSSLSLVFPHWSAMDSRSLAAEFASRTSGFWSYMTPETLADWVVRADLEPQPFGALPSAVPRLPGLVRAINDADARSLREVALGIAGIVIRTTVPAAAESAGQHWVLTAYGTGQERWFRLTVGMCWAAEISYWDDGRITTAFRMAESPIQRALDEGSLRVHDLDKFGIVRRGDGLHTFADDAVVFHCPDIDGLLWFLDQPAIAQAIRLMNARLVSTGQFAWRRGYDPALAEEAWAAAEALSLPDPLEIDIDSPTESPDAAARDEHDRLLVLLMARLHESGIEPFELRSPPVDLAWRTPDGHLHIALARAGGSEADLLRHALGEVVEHRHRLSAAGDRPTAVLLVTDLDDPTWRDVCAGVDVRLLTAAATEPWQLN